MRTLSIDLTEILGLAEDILSNVEGNTSSRIASELYSWVDPLSTEEIEEYAGEVLAINDKYTLEDRENIVRVLSEWRDRYTESVKQDHRGSVVNTPNKRQR